MSEKLGPRVRIFVNNKLIIKLNHLTTLRAWSLLLINLIVLEHQVMILLNEASIALSLHLVRITGLLHLLERRCVFKHILLLIQSFSLVYHWFWNEFLTSLVERRRKERLILLGLLLASLIINFIVYEIRQKVLDRIILVYFTIS